MRRYRLTYFLAQCFKGMWRNGVMSLASITVLMSCLVLIGSFGLLIMNIDTNLEQLGLLNEIVVFVDLEKDPDSEAKNIGLVGNSDTSAEDGEGADEPDAQTDEAEPEAPAEPLTREQEMERLEEIRNQILSLKNVSEVTLVTKEQALEEEREKYKEHDVLYDLVEEDNPLRDSFVVRYEDNSEVSTLVVNLGHIDGIDKINNRQDLAQSIERIKSSISLVLVWFMAILLAVSVFVIINTIKLALHARHEEITIMRYIGATDWFIMIPFLLEGVVIGILSSAIAFGVEWYIYGYVIRMMDESFTFIKILGFADVAYTIGIAFAGIGIITGIIGSVISTRKYLRA